MNSDLARNSTAVWSKKTNIKHLSTIFYNWIVTYFWWKFLWTFWWPVLRLSWSVCWAWPQTFLAGCFPLFVGLTWLLWSPLIHRCGFAVAWMGNLSGIDGKVKRHGNNSTSFSGFLSSLEITAAFAQRAFPSAPHSAVLCIMLRGWRGGGLT